MHTHMSNQKLHFFSYAERYSQIVVAHCYLNLNLIRCGIVHNEEWDEDPV